MNKVDVKHVLFHILVALFAIWALVYALLLGTTLYNTFSYGNPALSRLLVIWIFLNLVIGTALFIVIRLFRSRTTISKYTFYAYFLLAAAAVTTVLIVKSYL